MISNEISNIQKFDTENDRIKLSFKNVSLAETIFNILYMNSTLGQDFKNLRTNYSEENLNQVCLTINAENSTHLREYERNKISHEIFEKSNKNYAEFEKLLKDPSYPIISLIRALKGIKVTANSDKGKDEEKVIRDNYSFATKFCHYACYFLFDDDTNRDLYPIYDSVLSDYVKKSPEYKHSTEKDINIYKNYVNIIDEIINGKGISRNGFDHLIWLTNRKPSKAE